jgi:hypothetical protein
MSENIREQLLAERGKFDYTWSVKESGVTYEKISVIHSLMELGLLEKLPVVQLLKNFPAFYGTRRFITVHKSPPLVPILSQINPIHMHFSSPTFVLYALPTSSFLT